jgi:hypothetical protein
VRRAGLPVGQQGGRAQVEHDLPQARRRVLGVEADEAAARLERADHGRHMVDAVGQEEGHRPHLPAHRFQEARRHLVRQPVQDAVGDALARGDHGPGLGPARRLEGEQLVHPSPGEGNDWRGALGQQLLALLRSEQRQARHRALGAVGQAAEEHRELPGHAIDGRGIEEVGRELERQGDALVRLLRDLQGEVGPGVPDVDLVPGGDGVLELGALPRTLVEGEEHLEERVPALVARRCQLGDQLLEGQGLVLGALQHGAAHGGQELPQASLARHARPDSEQVDEHPDQPFGLGLLAARRGHAHHEVALLGALLGIPVEQDVEAGLEDHRERHALGAGQPAEPLREAAVEEQGALGSPEALAAGPRAVDRQVEDRRRAREVLAPVAQERVEPLPRQPLPLPAGEVRILDGQGRQRRGLPRERRPVEPGQLLQEDPDRPAVVDQVVQGEDEHPLVIAQLQDQDAQQRPRGEVEAQAVLGADALPQGVLPGFGGLGAQVLDRQGDAPLPEHPLPGDAADLGEGGAEDLVPPRQLVQAPLQQVDPEGAREVVGGQGDRVGLHRVLAPVPELLQEPEALLGEREGEERLRAAAGQPGDAALAGPLLLGQAQGEEGPLLG